MNFNEVDEARKVVTETLKNSAKRGRKRKNSSISLDDASVESPGKGASSKVRKPIEDSKKECRTGRFTSEEMAFCDLLILLFKEGQLPVDEGTKLNDFLSSMLKSKQSRLTKKMKVSHVVCTGSAIFFVKTNEINGRKHVRLFSYIFHSLLYP
jgi:hypothetical protein